MDNDAINYFCCKWMIVNDNDVGRIGWMINGIAGLVNVYITNWEGSTSYLMGKLFRMILVMNGIIHDNPLLMLSFMGYSWIMLFNCCLLMAITG